MGILHPALSEGTTVIMIKAIIFACLASVAFADAVAEAKPEAAADPWYGYYGRGLGYYGHGGGYGHGYGYYGKRSAEAEPEAKAEADPYYYGGYYGRSLGYYGRGYGYGHGIGYYGRGYGYGHGYGYYGKRSAEAEPEAKAEADPYYYGGYYGHGL